MIFRTILIFLKKRFLTKTQFSEKTVINMRVLPTDLDLLWHVNNGVYFSFMDFGRWDMIFRNGVYDLAMKNGWYSVVAGETIKFKKSLELWDKFQLETQIMGYDDKYFFIQQRFVKNGELMATGLVKVRFLKRKGGTVSTQEVMDLFKDQELQNRAQELSAEWYGIESKYLA
ncbi:acyl-CoA thioesterase [Peredibacter starrii]|uniref:Acyl-CoA thioesterase n=1 Tax=Peredibacter starrii TaxID=28202 RepID=A0AAX4HVB9_9BACT|nr:acyl-CoA thioesterase [Peredibacter starrii]WPU67107.1 acyl-CoA thioesterase [Peredibacter starrii]